MFATYLSFFEFGEHFPLPVVEVSKELASGMSTCRVDEAIPLLGLLFHR
jgi:hypothetical protein